MMDRDIPMCARKVTILQGSPRRNGNTAQLTAPFIKELVDSGCQCRTFFLYDKDILPCIGCRHCQDMADGFGCSRQDPDMQEIFDAVMEADLVVLATPVYSWYCTPPMKAVLDRLVYGMNKFYGKAAQEAGPIPLAKGKGLALITTCGYPPAKGADLLEEGIRRFCRHCRIEFLGALTEQNLGYDQVFMTKEREMRAREFARNILK